MSESQPLQTPPFAAPPFTAPANARRDQRVLIMAALAGVALTVIGIRFMVSPESAARFFGFPVRPAGYQMHAVIALRDVWLGIMALAIVALGEWRLLTVWLAAGALVCFGDAGIVWGDTAALVGQTGLLRLRSVLFHLSSGIFMTALAILAWRRVRRDSARQSWARQS